MYQQLKKMRQEEGFTLIELLIVIVILGVLAGIVVFSVSGLTDRGNTAACKSDIATVETAVQAYYAQNAAYPDATNYIAQLVPGFLASFPTGSVAYTPTPPAGSLMVTGTGTNCSGITQSTP